MSVLPGEDILRTHHRSGDVVSVLSAAAVLLQEIHPQRSFRTTSPFCALGIEMYIVIQQHPDTVTLGL